MSNDPCFITWRLETASADDLPSLEKVLQRVATLDFTFTDRVITIENGEEISHEIERSLGDYFDVLCVLPNTKGSSHAIRLFMQCKTNVNRFWKDATSFMLKQVRHSNLTTCIALDYLVDDEQLSAVATQTPNWFSHLRRNSRNFWKLSALYLLNRPAFSFEDLATQYEIPTESLKAMHRNSYRAIKREESPNPLWSTYNYGLERKLYTMEPVVRDKFLRLTRDD